MLAIAIKITWLITVSVELICIAIYRPSKNHQNAWIYLMTTFPYKKVFMSKLYIDRASLQVQTLK